MKVRELIKELSKLDPELNVETHCCSAPTTEAVHVITSLGTPYVEVVSDLSSWPRSEP